MPGLPVTPIVFAYNFPHKKTQDFLCRLTLLGMRPSFVLLADPVALNLPSPAMRVKPRHSDLVDPKTICARFSIPFEVVDHTCDRCVDLLNTQKPTIGVVAGARILPPKVIDCFSVGVLNFHPGLIPEVRGLDALQWSIHLGVPLGVTAHLINHQVDAGRIVDRRTIPEYEDDALVDLSLRLYETQVQMLESTLTAVASKPLESFATVLGGQYRRSYPTAEYATLPGKLAERHARRANAA